MSNGSASWLTDAGPWVSRSTTARRQPSERAWNRPSSPALRLDKYLGIHLSVSQRRTAVNRQGGHGNSVNTASLFPIYAFVLKIVALCFIGPWIATWATVMFSVP